MKAVKCKQCNIFYFEYDLDTNCPYCKGKGSMEEMPDFLKEVFGGFKDDRK
jgi:uncharacterized Zn finger protein (UPF0148 family)